ncbi:MAG: arsenic resistance N-acetyltransferase ArsN2 [Pseudomarimonas sp.]
MHRIQSASAQDVPAIRALLERSGLPISDLASAPIDLLVIHDGGGLIGVIGVERLSQHGLLRSLAVASEQRNSGLGDALVHAAEAHARALGLLDLVLLTTTAAPFFAKRGYTVIARGDAPDDVQRSGEFTSICPASATCMYKSLSVTA